MNFQVFTPINSNPQYSSTFCDARLLTCAVPTSNSPNKKINLSSDASTIHSLSHQQAKLQIMMQFIRDHYKKKITLADIAASASISKSSALQIFKSRIHLSPIAYLIQYRLSQAAVLLRTTTKPVSTIAEETGFTSTGYFCRKFKEFYQMRPNEYRKDKAAH